MMIYIFLCTINFVVKLYTYSLYLLDYEIAKFRKYDREKKITTLIYQLIIQNINKLGEHLCRKS